MLGGLARCGRCGGAMTRVTKGAKTKAGRPYLICEAAKVGKVGADGNRVCQYKAVHLEMIEQGLRDSLWVALDDAPTPGSNRALDAKIEGATVHLSDIEERISRIAGEIERGGASPVLRERLIVLEQEKGEATVALRALQDQRAAAFGPFVARRLGALQAAVDAEPFDPGAVNLRLREACRSVTVDYDQANLIFEWSHGGESLLSYGWPGLKPKRQA